jgi:sec-independent protein translocase protein TatC
MTFTEHLAELRVRIMRASVALIVAVFVCYAASENIFAFLVRPLLPLAETNQMRNDTGLDASGQPIPPPVPDAESAPKTGGLVLDKKGAPKVVTLSPFETVLVYMKIATKGGLILAMPFILFEACAFIFPGLSGKERNAVLFFLFGGGALAIFGVGIAYGVVFPIVVPVLQGWAPEFVETQFQMSTTLDQLTYLLLGFAVTFQLPMFLLVLVYLDLLTPQTLVSQWRLAIVVIAVISAIFTPPDALSMAVMMGPLLLLYLGSAFGAYIIVWMKKKRLTREKAAKA